MSTTTDTTHIPPLDFQEISLDDLDISQYNVRQRDITSDIDALAESIRAIGLQQPIVVQRQGGRYRILIGQRRYLAARQLGMAKITAHVLHEELNELQAKVRSFAENVQRRDLSPRDKSEACLYLLKELGSAKAVAERIGIGEQTVRRWLGYAAVPEGLKILVDEGRITRPTATRIAESVTDERQALAIAERIAAIKPTPDNRNRILEAVHEYPDRSVDVILRRANELQNPKEIIFVLPERWAEAIDKASNHLGKEPGDIAREATIEWLGQRRY